MHHAELKKKALSDPKIRSAYESMETEFTLLRQMLKAIDSPSWLEIDGGISPANAEEVTAAGANVLVAGTAVFSGPASIQGNIAAFRSALSES